MASSAFPDGGYLGVNHTQSHETAHWPLLNGPLATSLTHSLVKLFYLAFVLHTTHLHYVPPICHLVALCTTHLPHCMHVQLVILSQVFEKWLVYVIRQLIIPLHAHI